MKESQRPNPQPRKRAPGQRDAAKKAAEKLSKPPKDQREITIAPGRGPDVTLE